MRTPVHAPLLALLALSLVGCDNNGDCNDCSLPVVIEVEPNDLPAQANWLGDLYPGDAFAIEGRITQLGPDLLDGFALRSGSAVHVQFALWASEPGADLDLCLYDPDLGEYIACWETPAHPETGAFTIHGPGKEVHLVVSSYLGNSAYSLEVMVYEACCGDSAPEAIEADGPVPGHRPGTPARWARYASTERAEAPDAARLVLPAALVEIDLASGEVRREPVLVLPVRQP